MSDRHTLKRNAKILCTTAKPSLITAGLIYAVLILIVSALSSRLIGSGITERDAEKFMNAYYEGNIEAAVNLIPRFQPKTGALAIDTLLRLLVVVVAAGFVIFTLNSIRRTEPTYANLLDGFSIPWKVLFNYLLKGVLVFIGSLLLVVPGVILFYAYRQSLYLLIDHPEMTVIQSLRESRQMMKGHKWELFVMDLSFLGWHILGLIIPLADILVYPYTQTTYALYYEELCGACPEIPEFPFDPDRFE